MSWLSQGIAEVGNLWNSQPNWAKGLELGAGGLALGGIGLGAAGIGPLAGMFGGEAGLGGAAAADVGAGAATTTFDAAGTGALAAPSSWASTLGGGDIAAGGWAGGTAADPTAGLVMSGNAPGALPAGTDALGTPPLLGGQGGSIMYGTADPVSPFYDPAVFPDATAAAPAAETAAPGTVAAGTSAAGAAAKASPWSLAGLGNSLTPATALGAALGAGGLGYNMYQGYQQNQQLKALQSSIDAQSATAANTAATAQANAAPETALGTSLQQPLTTDTLPASAQASLDQQVQSTKAQIIAGYANRGQSADPSQNSALAADLANVDQMALSTKNTLETNYFNAGQQAIASANAMITAGLSASQISAQLPIQMQQLDLQLASATSASIASFAKGLTPTQTIQLQPAQQQAA